MSEHRMESVAERLKSGEPWIALVYPRGVAQEDRDAANAYVKGREIFWYEHGGIAIVFYKDETKLDDIKRKVAERIVF